MSDPIKDYAKRVAEAVLSACRMGEIHPIDAIIATVEPPMMQHHAAPTCDGWWWARYSGSNEWACVRAAMRYGGEYVAYTVVGSAPSPVFDRWVGPLLPPDTTEPAPQERTCTCTGACKGQEGLAPGWRCALSQPAPDVQAQIDAAVKAAVAPWLEEEKLWRKEAQLRHDIIDAAVARERELGDARVVAARADERSEMAELAYAALRDAGMHAADAFMVSRRLTRARSAKGV